MVAQRRRKLTTYFLKLQRHAFNGKSKMKKINYPLRVLHIYSTLNRGGAEKWLMDVINHTNRNEFIFDVCLTSNNNGAYEPEFIELGGKILRCPLSRNLYIFSKRFKSLLKLGKYNIVHSHLYYFSGFILKIAYEAGVDKRIAHIHPAVDFKKKILRE